jgi:TRAP-type C4-dicarboxylate transport system substrate-binding protein
MDSISRLAEEVTKRTDGRIKFKVYGPELGDWAEVNEMVNRGDIDMMLVPMSASYDPRWNVTFAPYIVTNYEEAKKVFGPGGFMDEIFKIWAKDISSGWEPGFRVLRAFPLAKRPPQLPRKPRG